MGCGGSKEEEQFSNVNAPAASGASKTPAAITKADTDAAIAGAVKDPESKRKFSERKRRRVAVASENSEMLASVRWQSAFDAIRKEEFKLPQHVNKIRDVITNHGIFGGLDAEFIEQNRTYTRKSAGRWLNPHVSHHQGYQCLRKKRDFGPFPTLPAALGA